ncbi:Otolin-1 Precursor [Collichthys lucidus]|uniref:Otolin-1 n=1 Tax=Collichthys lucidus TaxID=240159 RepID=A0A4U5UVM0_COLLU|nr:Otolin-1 Precursor [Collichthys lucidus]
MLSRLLGVLALCSLCSAMLLNNTAPGIGPGVDNTIDWRGPGSDSDSDSNSGSDSDTDENGDRHYPYNARARHHHNLPGPPGNLTLARMTMGDNEMPILPDLSICDMLLSSPNPPPINEIPFFCLCSHCKGTVGPKGDRGDRGVPGQKGDVGEKGMAGSVGFSGMKGDRGYKGLLKLRYVKPRCTVEGEKGDRGTAGPQGQQGPQGENGICPASCDSVQGPPGEQGPSGPAGSRGLPGIKGERGPMGFKGDKGDLGIPGTPGVDGQKGDQGMQGICECTDGADGANGAPGANGQKGDKGDTGPRGAQGNMGLKGNMGAMGMMGQPGPCSPTIKSSFSAAINQSFPEPNLPVPFNTIIYNQQNHFDFKGMYTAPVNGTYVFTFNMAVAERTLKVGLFHNFWPIIKATEVVGNEQSSVSQTIVLHLSRFDRVWLQVKSSTTNGMYTDTESSSTFSGWLLFPDSCDPPLGRQMLPPPDDNDFTWEGPDGTTTPPP